MDAPLPSSSSPSSATFLALASSSPDGICTTDRDGVATFVNDVLVRMLGYDDAGELVGRSIFDVLVEDVREAWHELAGRTTSLPDLAEFELRCHDGSTLPVMLSITPLGDDRFEGVLAVVRDIAERRRSEEALAEREAMLSALVANVPGMVYRCERSPGWPMRFVSDGSRRLLGWTPEEMLAEPTLYGSRLHPEDVESVHEAVEAAGDGPFAVRYRLRHRDGSIRWVWERGRTTVAATATTPAVLEGIVVDITRQVRDARALVESEQRYRSLIESLPGGVVVTRRGTVVFASDSAARLLGVRRRELLGEPLRAFLSPLDDDERLDLDLDVDADRHVAGGAEVAAVDPPRRRYRVLGDAPVHEVAALSTPSTFEDESATQTFFWDITQEERAASLQAAQDQVLDALAGGAPLLDVLGVLSAAVERALPGRICGILLAGDSTITEVIGASVPEPVREAVGRIRLDLDDVPCARALRTGMAVVAEDVLAEDWGPELREAFRAAGLRSCWSIPVRTEGGVPLASIAVLGSTASAPSPDEQLLHDHFRRLLSLVMEQARAQRFVDADTRVDPLTGLFTRGHVLRLVDEALAAQRSTDGAGGSVAVLLVGLDDFAQLTDALGSDVTDEILRAVGALLEATADEGDLVARFAPTTFLIAATSASEVALDQRAMQLQAAIAAPFRVRDREVFVTASVGIAMSVDGHDTAASLVANADVALYQAMGSGPAGQRRFDDRLRHQAARRVQLEPAMARAVEAGEFRVVYQPQVDLRTGVVVGAEALVRWDHPTEGTVAPNDFIPLAERNGLIVPIGSWVLEESCRQAAAWRELRPEQPPFVSVNLSARQLADPELIQRVRAALEGPGLDPALLRLELTETAVMADPASATVILRELRSIGVRLSIDDFGTGYSSLVYLKRFPVDELKIDRAFVDGLGERADDSAIVAAIVNLAQSLGMSPLAEGVERPTQAVELLRLGCHVAQGFLFARPLGPDTLGALVVHGFAAVVSPPVATAPPPATEVTVTTGSEGTDGQAGADAAMVALVHELRTPLTMIRGFTELLEDARHPPEEAVPAILRGVERLTRLLQGIDDVNRLDRGSILLDLREEKLHAVVDDVVREVHLTRPSARIEVEAPHGDELLTRIDRTRVEQILVNLVTNALRHGPPDGPVRVVCGRDGAEVVCSVIDEGPGLAPEASGSLFRKYARGDRSKPGSGLGLYLARGLARAHGGDVVYRRAETGGAEFRLTLPALS